jgi:beta-galactosidase
LSLEVELRDEDKTIARGVQPVANRVAADPNASMDPVFSAPVHASTETSADPARHAVSLTNLGPIKLWDLRQPTLYNVYVRLLEDGKVIDQDSRRIGFREAISQITGFRSMEGLLNYAV